MPAIQHWAASVMVGGALALGLGGCTPEQPASVPADALMATEGPRELVYRPGYDGTLYVYDVSQNRLVYTGPVRADEMVRVDPQNGRITIEGKTVSETVRSGDEHRIYIERKVK